MRCAAGDVADQWRSRRSRAVVGRWELRQSLIALCSFALCCVRLGARRPSDQTRDVVLGNRSPGRVGVLAQRLDAARPATQESGNGEANACEGQDDLDRGALTQIAMACGFADQSHLIRSFRRDGLRAIVAASADARPDPRDAKIQSAWAAYSVGVRVSAGGQASGQRTA
jgi:AraC-like DNA-binding protein